MNQFIDEENEIKFFNYNVWFFLLYVMSKFYIDVNSDVEMWESLVIIG